MAYVFISYSHEDKDYARKLAAGLKQQNIDYWMDDRIDYGSQWARVIQEKLEGCQAVIVILSTNAYNSDWVQSEIAFAQQEHKVIFPVLLEGKAWVSLASAQYADVRSGAMPPVSYFETVKKRLGMQIARIAPEEIAWKLPKPSGPTVWKFPKPSDAQLLSDAIVDQILKTMGTRSSRVWEIGIFRITYSSPVENIPKKKRQKWLTNYLLWCDLINTDLLRRYDSRLYLENKEDFDKYTFKPPVQTDQPSASGFIVPSMEETRNEFLFRKRLNLELGLLSETEFMKIDVENFAKKLIEIHEAHHIPVSEIKIKVVK